MRLQHPLRRACLIALAALCLGAALGACGQKGSLYLPEDNAHDNGQS